MTEQVSGPGLFPRAGMIARLKVGLPDVRTEDPGLNVAERQLTDILDIGSAAKERAQKLRVLDAHLRLAQTVQGLLNGAAPRLSLLYTPVSVEYIKLENPYLTKTDMKV